MQTPFLSHELHVEFPDLAERVHALKASNGHFARLLDQHGELDKRILKAEEGIEAIDDFALEDLKKQRLWLKDELFKMLKES